MKIVFFFGKNELSNFLKHKQNFIFQKISGSSRIIKQHPQKEEPTGFHILQSNVSSEILHRSQPVQRWQWGNVVMVLGNGADTDQKHRLYQQDKMIYCLRPMHLLGLKRIKVPEFPVLRKNSKYNTEAASKLFNAQCTNIS